MDKYTDKVFIGVGSNGNRVYKVINTVNKKVNSFILDLCYEEDFNSY